MCGRYSLHSHPDVIALQFGLSSVPAFAPRYNIAPAASVLIVRTGGAALARWQLGGKYHNLRADTVTQKPSWRARYRNQRCLVPASGFYEWKPLARGKQPYYIRPARDEVFAFAGLWDAAGGAESSAVITTEPNGVVAQIHDRMPVIVAPADYSRWLQGDEDLLRPAPEDSVIAYPVSNAVNSSALDSENLIQPLPSGVEPQGITRDLFGH